MPKRGDPPTLLFGTAAALLLSSIVLLRVVGLERSLTALQWVAGGVPTRAIGTTETIPRAVELASRRMPIPFSCLERAVVCHVMFDATGASSELRLGVDKTGRQLNAHAWVERDGAVVIGDIDDLDRYRPLSSDRIE